MKTLELIRSFPTILVSVKYQLTRLVGTFLISSSWSTLPYPIEPVLNHYITEGTMQVRMFLISSSWSTLPYPIEPVLNQYITEVARLVGTFLISSSWFDSTFD